MNSRRPTNDDSAADVSSLADEIATGLATLSSLAASDETFGFLQYLLEMARSEAVAIANNRNQQG